MNPLILDAENPIAAQARLPPSATISGRHGVGMPYYDIDDRRLHYIDQGSGPVLLLGHSFLWDHRMWGPQIEQWSQRYRVIAVDAWGHGESDPPPEGLTLDLLADHHAALIHSLDITSCGVVGLSMGGMWGLRFALRHPELTAALIALDTAASAEPAEPKARYFALLDIVEQAGALPPTVREQVVPGFFSPTTVENRPELVYAFDTELAQFPPERIPAVVAMGRMIFSRTGLTPAELCQLKSPTLVGVGADDRYRPVPESQALAEALPNAELQVWPDAGHIANLDQPHLVSDAVQTFIESVLTNG